MSFPDPVARKVKVTVKKSSGETWLDTEPLPILSPMSYIVFEVAQVDRRDSVVPYLVYENEVQPYWKPLIDIPAIRNGCETLELTVVLQPIDTPIAVLYAKFRPLNEDSTEMSYKTFKNRLTDPEDERYLDMERLMNTVYPVEAFDTPQSIQYIQSKYIQFIWCRTWELTKM